MDYKNEIQKVKNSNYSKEIKEKLISHYTKLSKVNTNINTVNSNNIKCTHYIRHNFIVSPCCNKIYSCRLCHDSNENHKLDRKKIKQIKCKGCFCIQETNNECINKDCYYFKKKRNHYFCSICNLFSDDKKKDIYHCEKCGICRIGKKEDYFHCDKCCMCLPKSIQKTHHCVSTTKQNCMFCLEDLFGSTKNVMPLKCGHYVHVECFNKSLQTGNIENSYRCLLCRKSILDMSSMWNQLDTVLQNETIPDEFVNKKRTIYCNDCGKKTETQMHFVYHKCQNCGSYNTEI